MLSSSHNVMLLLVLLYSYEQEQWILPKHCFFVVVVELPQAPEDDPQKR